MATYHDLVAAGFKAVSNDVIPDKPYEDWSSIGVEVIVDYVLAELWRLAPQVAEDVNLSVTSIERVILAIAEPDSVANPPYPPRE